MLKFSKWFLLQLYVWRVTKWCFQSRFFFSVALGYTSRLVTHVEFSPAIPTVSFRLYSIAVEVFTFHILLFSSLLFVVFLIYISCDVEKFWFKINRLNFVNIFYFNTMCLFMIIPFLLFYCFTVYCFFFTVYSLFLSPRLKFKYSRFSPNAFWKSYITLHKIAENKVDKSVYLQTKYC